LTITRKVTKHVLGGIGLAAMLLLLPVSAQAADDNIGCGLGSQLWDGSEGLPAHILGATTNGLVGNQTFGLSTGTLGCDAGGTVTASARTRMFASANFDQLARDMAHGEGEALTTLAHLLGVAEGDRAVFYSFTRRHFGELYGSDGVTAGDLLVQLDALMARDATLSRYARS